MEVTEMFPVNELKHLEEILIRELTEKEQKDLDDCFEEVWKEMKGEN